MKKATTKQERKWGNWGNKKDEESKITKDNPAPKVKDRKHKVTKVIVDGYSIIKFKSESEALKYIKKQHEESDRLMQSRTSYTIM